MSQWNALNVNVIKTRRIECGKLNLPVVLRKSPESYTKSSSPEPKFVSTEVQNLESCSQECKQQLNKNHSSVDGLISPSHLSTEDSLSSSIAEDEVFQESFETPSEKESNFRKSSTKRCLSLPAYLSPNDGGSCELQPDVCLRPRCLFEEALNLESYSESARNTRPKSRAVNEGSGDHIFPREQERSVVKGKQSRTIHAERMKRNESSSPITFDNNNNLLFDQNNLPENTTTPKSSFDAREWEQKVLVLTADYEFGTKSSTRPRDECDTRSRSVALTENISAIAKDKSAKDQVPERQVKSEGKTREMPKLQTVVWDYIKRKSTKRKRKNETNQKQENVKATSQESYSEIDDTNEDTTCNDDVPNDVKSFDADSTGKIWSNDKEILSDYASAPNSMKTWKSVPNLKSNCDSEISRNIPLRRFDSFNFLCPTLNHKSPPKLPAMELKLNSQSLTFALTTATEERPMHKRMETLRQSREWLLKELKSMREEDRKLARQFIHLRSAIVKMREYCEKEELDYDSESDGTQKMNETNTLHKENKQSGLKERKIPIHDTPTRNILSYC